MELGRGCIIVEAFPRAIAHRAIWDPWSMETNFVIEVKSRPRCCCRCMAGSGRRAFVQRAICDALDTARVPDTRGAFIVST